MMVGARSERVPEEDMGDGAVLTGRRVAAAVVSIVVGTVLLVWFFPWAAGAPWPTIGAVLARTSVGALLVLVCAGLLMLAVRGLMLRAAVASSSLPRALGAESVATGLSLMVPGGSALAPFVIARFLDPRRRDRSRVWPGIAATAVSDLLAGLAIALMGSVAWIVAAPDGRWRGAAIAIGLLSAVAAIGLVLVLRRRAFRGLIDGAIDGLAALSGSLPMLGRSGDARTLAARALEMRDGAAAVASARWPMLVLGTAGARAIELGALAAAARAMGVDVPLLALIAVYAVGRLLAALPVSPGGAGVAQTGAAAALIAFGAPAAAASGAAVLMMVPSLAVPVACGALAWVTHMGASQRGSATAPSAGGQGRGID